MRNIFFLALVAIVSCKTANLPQITVYGVAKDAKAGAIIITDDNEVYYIDGQDSWPEKYLNKKLKVSGWLKEKVFDKSQAEIKVQTLTGVQKIIVKARVLFAEGQHQQLD